MTFDQAYLFCGSHSSMCVVRTFYVDVVLNNNWKSAVVCDEIDDVWHFYQGNTKYSFGIDIYIVYRRGMI